MSEDETTKNVTVPATNPGELDEKGKSDPRETAGDEPESGGGYGNHAEDWPAADKAN